MKFSKLGAIAFGLFSTLVLAAESLPDDPELQTKISAAFANNTAYSDALVAVHSVRGFILLTGQVTTEEARSQATNTVVFASSDIRRIINELAVVSVVDASTAATDTTLSSAISAELEVMDPELAKRVTVVVHRAEVYLMGALSSNEQEQVANLVSKIPGVANIKTSFELL